MCCDSPYTLFTTFKYGLLKYVLTYLKLSTTNVAMNIGIKFQFINFSLQWRMICNVLKIIIFQRNTQLCLSMSFPSWQEWYQKCWSAGFYEQWTSYISFWIKSFIYIFLWRMERCWKNIKLILLALTPMICNIRSNAIYEIQGTISLKLLGGKLTPNLVYFVLRRELLKPLWNGTQITNISNLSPYPFSYE